MSRAAIPSPWRALLLVQWWCHWEHLNISCLSPHPPTVLPLQRNFLFIKLILSTWRTLSKENPIGYFHAPRRTKNETRLVLSWFVQKNEMRLVFKVLCAVQGLIWTINIKNYTRPIICMPDAPMKHARPLQASHANKWHVVPMILENIATAGTQSTSTCVTFSIGTLYLLPALFLTFCCVRLNIAAFRL